MKYVIPCAGDSSRWKNYLDVEKHFAPLLGEGVLARTVRLVNVLDPDADVALVLHDPNDPRYEIPGSRRVRADLDSRRKQSDKILSSISAWGEERTVVLFGDVFFTEQAMVAITSNRDPWTAFARPGPSKVTGCDHAELFGFAFDAAEQDRMADAANRCVALAKAGSLQYWSGGWQIYRAALGKPDEEILGTESRGFHTRNEGCMVEIHDGTEDLDAPADWDAWCFEYARADEDTRVLMDQGASRGVTPVFVSLDAALAGIERRGVVHVGGHLGQEVPTYRLCGFERIHLVEPNPNCEEALRAFSGVRVYPFGAGTMDTGTLHVPVYSEQASLLRPVDLGAFERVDVDVRPLSDMQAGCNVAVLDVQGGELDVLRSADMDALDAVVIEVDSSKRYSGAPTPEQIATFFTERGWALHSTWPHRWDFLREEVWVRGPDAP